MKVVLCTVYMGKRFKDREKVGQMSLFVWKGEQAGAGVVLSSGQARVLLSLILNELR